MSSHKICFYISTLRRGGAERVIANLADYFYKVGYQVTIVTTFQKKDELEYPVKEGIHRVLSEPPASMLQGGRFHNFITRYRRLREIWKSESPDIVVSFVGKNNMMAILTAWGLHIPVVISVRGNPMNEYASGIMRRIAFLLFPHAAGIVLQTRQAYDFFPKQIRKKSRILSNPLNPEFLMPLYQGSRRKEIVVVATLDYNKNVIMLVRAFAKLRSLAPEWTVKIYGIGPEMETLRRTAEELQINEWIELCGERAGIANLIRESSVFVMTSYTEGTPNALIEAMALGLCCISTDCPCGGPGELIQHGENGILIPVGDEAALERELLKVIQNEEYRMRLGRNAFKIQEKMDPSKVFMEWKQYLDGMMNEK